MAQRDVKADGQVVFTGTSDFDMSYHLDGQVVFSGSISPYITPRQVTASGQVVFTGKAELQGGSGGAYIQGGRDTDPLRGWYWDMTGASPVHRPGKAP